LTILVVPSIFVFRNLFSSLGSKRYTQHNGILS
jgi:hypothetical protein